jgi:hypothetical protein
MRYYALSYLIFCLTVFAFILFPIWRQLLTTEEARASMKGVNNEVYEHMQGNFQLIGLNVSFLELN